MQTHQPYPGPPESESLFVGPWVCVLRSLLGGSGARQSLRTIILGKQKTKLGRYVLGSWNYQEYDCLNEGFGH